MYAVVGCSECEALWLLEGRPETTQCPRCGKRHRTTKLKRFVETDDEDHAREVRASMLANRQGHGEAFAELDSFDALEAQAEAAGVDEETYLEESGLDPGAVAAAGERAESGPGSLSREEVVRAALRELDAPGEDEVVAYADEHGVPADYVRTALEKLRRTGEVVDGGDGFRLV